MSSSDTTSPSETTDSSSNSSENGTQIIDETSVTSHVSSSYSNIGSGVKVVILSLVFLSVGVSLFSDLSLLSMFSFLNTLQLISLLKLANLAHYPPHFLLLVYSLEVTLGRIPGLNHLPRILPLLIEV